ncbi:uncharacterized protein LOC144097158 [Amblyomma americanum]
MVRGLATTPVEALDIIRELTAGMEATVGGQIMAGTDSMEHHGAGSTVTTFPMATVPTLEPGAGTPAEVDFGDQLVPLPSLLVPQPVPLPLELLLPRQVSPLAPPL